MDGVHIPTIPTPTLARIRDLILTDFKLLLPLALILDRGLFETWSSTNDSLEYLSSINDKGPVWLDFIYV